MCVVDVSYTPTERCPCPTPGILIHWPDSVLFRQGWGRLPLLAGLDRVRCRPGEGLLTLEEKAVSSTVLQPFETPEQVSIPSASPRAGDGLGRGPWFTAVTRRTFNHKLAAVCSPATWASCFIRRGAVFARALCVVWGPSSGHAVRLTGFLTSGPLYSLKEWDSQSLCVCALYLEIKIEVLKVFVYRWQTHYLLI